MGYRSSGNLTVDAMGSVAITGNVIPEEWYKHVVKKATGKPYLLAITILADLVYWYRPTEVRDERTGEVIGWKKKFHGELLQKSYQEYANKFGESKKTIKLAFDQLVELGVIRRYFYNVEYSNGRVIPNQMFIDLNIQVLKAISYPAEDGGNTSKRAIRKLVPCNITDDLEMEEDIKNNGISIVADKAENICGQNGQGMLTNLSGYPDKKVDISSSEKDTYADSFGEESCDFGEGYPSDAVRTNTYNNSNNSYKDHIISIKGEAKTQNHGADKIDEIKQMSGFMDRIIKSHINYDWHMEHDDAVRKDDYHDLYLLIHDVMCGKQTSPLIVNKTAVDPDDVKKRFLQLNEMHLEYVLDSLAENPNRDGIRDIRSYMLTCLYNAPVTMGQFYKQWVNHDSHNGMIRESEQSEDFQ